MESEKILNEEIVEEVDNIGLRDSLSKYLFGRKITNIIDVIDDSSFTIVFNGNCSLRIENPDEIRITNIKNKK